MNTVKQNELRALVGDSLEVLDAIKQALAGQDAERILELVNGYIDRASAVLSGEQQRPFAWYRIPPTGVVLVAGENPPKGQLWSPLYRAPIHHEHPDTERFFYVCEGFDGFEDRDFHEEACKLAGGEEPQRDHYLLAYRAIVDTVRVKVEVPKPK